MQRHVVSVLSSQMPPNANEKHVPLAARQVLTLQNSARLKDEISKRSVIKSTQDDIVRVMHVIVST